jgi:hypothetical protein
MIVVIGHTTTTTKNNNNNNNNNNNHTRGHWQYQRLGDDAVTSIQFHVFDLTVPSRLLPRTRLIEAMMQGIKKCMLAILYFRCNPVGLKWTARTMVTAFQKGQKLVETNSPTVPFTNLIL